MTSRAIAQVPGIARCATQQQTDRAGNQEAQTGRGEVQLRRSPAEPEQEDAQQCQRSVVSGHV